MAQHTCFDSPEDCEACHPSEGRKRGSDREAQGSGSTCCSVSCLDTFKCGYCESGCSRPCCWPVHWSSPKWRPLDKPAESGAERTTYEEFRDSSPANALLLCQEEKALLQEELRLANKALAAAEREGRDAEDALRWLAETAVNTGHFTPDVEGWIRKAKEAAALRSREKL